MALEIPLFTIPLEANGDISGKQYYCVKHTTTAKRIVVCDTDGEPFIGILQNKPDAAGKAAEVMLAGVSKVSANEALTAGDFWGTSSDGQATKVEATETGADVRDFVMGVVIEGVSNAAELATVTLGFHTFKVPPS